MPMENAETVRQVVNALNRRDLHGFLACCTDDVELHSATAGIEGTHVGAEGIRSLFADLDDTAPDFRVDVERLQSVGPDKILAFERGTAHGRSSGVALEEGIPLGTVYEFAGARIKRIRVFLDRQEARNSSGLSD